VDSLRQAKGPQEEKQKREWLKTKHGLSTNDLNDIDDEVKRWLRKAYDMDAEARRGKPPTKLSA
jgi:hypothetical protein